MAKEIKPFPIKKILLARERIVDACSSRRNVPITGDGFMSFVNAVHQEIGFTDLGAVCNSLRSVAGQILNDRLIEELSWRLAGNLHRLKAGRVVPPWTTQNEKEWVTIQVCQVLRRFKRYRAKTQEQVMRADSKGMVHRYGGMVRFDVITGLAAGRRFERFWSEDFCDVAKTSFGFDRFNREKFSRNVSSRPTWPMLDLSEFFRLRAQVLVEPDLCLPGNVGFNEIKGTSSTKKWCREIMKKRLRDGFECPQNYAEDFPCHACPFGLDACRAACHQTTFEIGHCDRCDRNQRYFDPEISVEYCVDCAIDCA